MADLDPAWDTPAPEENMMPGTRRLDTDVTEYEYVDTYPRYVPIIVVMNIKIRPNNEYIWGLKMCQILNTGCFCFLKNYQIVLFRPYYSNSRID